MATMDIVDGKYVLSQVVTEAGEISHTLGTKNKFVDKDIQVKTTISEGKLGSYDGEVSAESDTGIIGDASPDIPEHGHYIKVSGNARATVEEPGWIDDSEGTDVQIDDVYYEVKEASFFVDENDVKTESEGYVGADTVVGTVPDGESNVSGGELVPGDGNAEMTSDGYYNGSRYDTSDKIALSSSKASGYYKLTAKGSGDVARRDVTRQVTEGGYFHEDEDPVVEIEEGSATSNEASKEYFVKKSTISATSVTPSTSDQTVSVEDGYYPSKRTVTVKGIKSAVLSVSGDNVVTPSVELDGSNVEFGNTNNGIALTATGGGTARATASGNVTTEGLVNTGSIGTTNIDSDEATSIENKYISGVTVEQPASGTNEFSVTIPNGDSTEKITFHVLNDGNVVID